MGIKSIHSLLGPLDRPLVRLFGFLKWSFPLLGRVLASSGYRERRLLVVYDTSSQPFSIGDILTSQEGSLVLRERYGVETVDFALVYDPKNPASSDAAFSSITESNALYHLASVLPVAQVNQHLGSLFLFNSHQQLARFISDASDQYHVWPSGWQCASRDYLYYEVFNDLLFDHYRQHHAIPHLTCRQHLAEWAERFFQEHARSQVPVTVNLRNNPAFQVHRNSQLDSWLGLFDHCRTRYPAKFIVVCALAEVDPRLRSLPNVVIAKDHYTSVEQDLALIHASAAHMGAGSGPASMAWFSEKPYLMVNTVYAPQQFAHEGMILQVEENIQRFWFANPSQRIAGGAETVDLLVDEFTRIWNEVNINRWQSAEAADSASQDKLGMWLR